MNIRTLYSHWWVPWAKKKYHTTAIHRVNMPQVVGFNIHCHISFNWQKEPKNWDLNLGVWIGSTWRRRFVSRGCWGRIKIYKLQHIFQCFLDKHLQLPAINLVTKEHLRLFVLRFFSAAPWTTWWNQSQPWQPKHSDTVTDYFRATVSSSADQASSP